VSPLTIWFTGGGVIAFIILGYTLLVKYPVSIVRLRQYLGVLADGGLPGQVALSKDEDDLSAVQKYLERIISIAEERIQMIQRQHIIELKAERQRVMVESISTMCHHFGQPATAMCMSLYRLRNNPTPAEVPAILTECEEAYNAMSDIFDKLRGISHYYSEAYLNPSFEQAKSSKNLPDSQIIKE
jgi:signal transduction histidine kinase